MKNAVKVPAADVFSAIIVGLTYWMSGEWRFPGNVDPERYCLVKNTNEMVFTTDGLFLMVEALEQKVERNLGRLSSGSVPVYVNYIRKGRRPNCSNGLPSLIPVSFSRKTDTITLGSRSYLADLQSGDIKMLPQWLFSSNA